MDTVSSSQFANNALWRFIDVISRKIIALGISIVLARLIAPEAYGIVALTTVFITFSDIFILNGFNIALIRKDVVSSTDYSTVTYLSLIFTTVMYLVFYITSPFIASFYECDILSPVLRVITILLFFESVSSVIRAYATRELQFKKMALSSFISNVASGLLALILAFEGFGVWALVVQQVCANFLDMSIMSIIFRWRVRPTFSIDSAKSMTKFTMGVLGTSFLDFFGNNVCSLIIGKTYTTKDLGYYNRANLFPETIGLNAYSSINSVLLPTLASRQSDIEGMKRVARKVMSLTEYIILPLMFGLMAIADNLINLLLTEKWAPAIPMMYFCCLYYAINPIRAISYSIFYSMAKSKTTMYIELIRSLLMVSGIILVAIIFKMGLIYVLLANLLISIFVALQAQFEVYKLISYSIRELVEDIFPSLMLSLIMLVIVYSESLLSLGRVSQLVIQIFTGLVVYVALSIIARNKNFIILVDFLKQKFSQWKH